MALFRLLDDFELVFDIEIEEMSGVSKGKTRYFNDDMSHSYHCSNFFFAVNDFIVNSKPFSLINTFLMHY
jgi:hypothetical protein